MLIDPQTPPIFAQNANIEPFPQIASYPGDDMVNAQPQRQTPPWMQARQMLPPAQAPRPQMPQGGMGGGMPPWMQQQMPQQQNWGPPPWMQQQQGPPPWMQQAPPWMQGGGGMGYGGGGWGGPPPWMQRRQQMYQPPMGNQFQGQMGGGYQQPQYAGNSGQGNAAAPAMPPQQQARPFQTPGPQYNSQAVRPQPAGTVNQAQPQAAPPAFPNRQAAITPTPIYNRGNELA
jgi:hypothetical protein